MFPARVFDGENRPLINHEDGTPHSSVKKKSWITAAVVMLSVAGMVGLYRLLFPTQPATAMPMASTFYDASYYYSEENATNSVMYRPYCQSYGNSKYATVRVLQTSKAEPSQAWAPLLCDKQLPPMTTNVKTNTQYRRWWRTSNVASEQQQQQSSSFGERFGAPDAVLQVNLSQIAFPRRAVPILGFGGAFTEAAALNYESLTQTGKDTVMELLFGKSGLGYSLGRIHINSVDFSIQSYSFDTTDGDFELKNFDTGVHHDVATGMVDMALRATSVFREAWGSKKDVVEDNHGDVVVVSEWADGKLQLFASPWSPPPWMKAPTPDDVPGALHAENMTNSAQPVCLRDGAGPESRYAKAWALYFSKFISAYGALGLPFFAVTVQNEPEFPAPWEACSYTPETQSQFIAYHLGPTLRNYHPEVKILMFDHNKDHVNNWAQYILNYTSLSNPPSAQYVNGTAYHWYAGGMDRLLDGAQGAPNLHRLQTNLEKLLPKSQQEHHIVLGSEACHCPTTGYSGGDPDIYWARAERYAHSILSDLAAGSNGWLEWNFILDSIGGPNHLKNLCDAALLAVPHRAKGVSGVPPTLPFEHAGHPFGANVGDGRTREELNSLGFPAKFVDAGIVVQPLYNYMGHISRHVRPGSRAVTAIVDHPHCNGTLERTFRPKGQVVAGGGMNDLARSGIEVTVWPCEGSTRQQWKWNSKKQIQVFGHDWLGNSTTSCLSKRPDQDLLGLTLTSCTSVDAGVFDLVPVSSNMKTLVKFKLLDLNATSTTMRSKGNGCLVIKELENRGGANGPRGGAQVILGSCASAAAEWIWHEELGEIASVYFSIADAEGDQRPCMDVCLTTGWPFLQIGAYDTTPNGESNKTIVVLNEAKDSANYVLVDGNDVVLSASIPPRSIQTILLS